MIKLGKKYYLKYCLLIIFWTILTCAGETWSIASITSKGKGSP